MGICLTRVDIIDVLVAQDDVKDGNDEDKGANEGFSLQLFDRKEGHHAHLVADDDEEGGIGRRLDQVALRVDLLAVHIEQVQTVDHVP